MTNIKNVLKRLDLEETGTYKDHFYIINLKDSNEYAKTYTKLDKNAINTEYPEFAKNTNEATIKIINYFELEEDSVLYDIFLIANFVDDTYYLKITERTN